MTVARPDPLVSIIVPAYNAERFIGRALESAVSQTYTNLEIVVIDDGSCDRTAEVIRGFRDPRIRYLHQPNLGQGRARNNGIRTSAGAYITFLDADDFYLPGKVGQQVAFLEAQREFGAVFCNVLHFYSHDPRRLFGRRPAVTGGDIFPALLHSSLINPNTLMVRGQILRSGFSFREDRYYPEEWDLYLRLSRSGVQFGYLDEDHVIVEVREDSNTTMDIQWILKRNALEMFEDLFAGMNEAERTRFHANRVLRRCRLNLAAAYLVVGNKDGFGEVISGVFPRLTARLLQTAVSVVPAGLLREASIRFWRWRQVRSFALRATLASDQAGTPPVLSRGGHA